MPGDDDDDNDGGEVGGEGEKIRTRLAAEVLDEALEALQSDIDIAIYDASNINMQRRRLLKDSVAASGLHAKASGGGGEGRRGGGRSQRTFEKITRKSKMGTPHIFILLETRGAPWHHNGTPYTAVS